MNFGCLWTYFHHLYSKHGASATRAVNNQIWIFLQFVGLNVHKQCCFKYCLKNDLTMVS